MEGQKNEIQIKVSIIIPVYNMRKYLHICLESVEKQTLQDIEIICIDDGSSDDSIEILKNHAKADRRIKIIHKSNTGYGDSVNIGIEKAQGEYVGIVEPDDYIEREMMDTLYHCAKENQLDIVSSDYKWFFDDGKDRKFSVHTIYDDEKLYNRVFNVEAENSAICGNYINPAGLFRRGFLLENGIKHNTTPGASFQDRGFCFLSLLYAERIMVLRDLFYCYRHDNPNSSIACSDNIDAVIKEYRLTGDILYRDNKKIKFMPELLRREYGGCRYAFSRSSHEHKKRCVWTIHDEFCLYKEEGKLNLSAFPEDWKQEVLQIMENPDAFWQDFSGLQDEIHEKLKTYDRCIIYGAGVVGKRIYDGMYEEDKAKIRGFCVTDMRENATSYKGCKIRGIEEYILFREETAVIVGVAAKCRMEIVNILSEKEFTHTIILNSVGANI